MSHRDSVKRAPDGFIELASSTASPVAAFEDPARGIYAIQFHPEVAHTPYGQQILTTFLEDICGADRSWSAASIVDEQIARIRAQVGDGRVDLRPLRRRRLLGRRAARAPRRSATS